MSHCRRRGSWLAALAVTLAAAALATSGPAACSRTDSSRPAAPPDQVYTVRGRIESLPDKNQPLSELSILHEPIPTFVRRDGTLGMDSMAMPFTPAPGVSLAGLAVGDPVEFTFEVRWKSSPFSQLTSIRKLPAGTELKIGKAE